MKFIVREIIRADLPILYKYVSDREIAYLTNNYLFETFEDFKSTYDLYLNGNSEDLKIFSILLGDTVIGKMEIGYDLRDKMGSFDIMIGKKELWRRGFGVKALNVLFSYGFNNLGLNRLSCEVYRFNESSIHLMRKMNMHVDGMLREAQFVHGKFVDIFIFSLLRKEYEGDVYHD
ncbi:GNAT family N-acetyltransferase [Mycoplasmatota bacterium]|nr:GNAT family N-acetyltransferase [Mycoplasmatota bacterium]